MEYVALEATPYVIFQVLSAILAAAVLLFTVKAYRYSGEPFLISFFSGFALLETSYGFVLVNRLIVGSAAIYHGTLWVQQLTQTVAFALLAITYHFKDRNLTASRAVQLTLAFIGVLSAALLAYFALPGYFALAPRSLYAFRSAAAPYLYALSLALLGYVIYDASRTLTVVHQKSNLALIGFGVLAAGQLSWVYWGITDNMGALLLANLSLVLSLALFAAPPLAIWSRHKAGLP